MPLLFPSGDRIPLIVPRFVNLERATEGSFGHRASISRELFESVFKQFDIHSGFLLDLVGRPNYWSAVSRLKDVAGEAEGAFGLYQPLIIVRFTPFHRS